MTKIERDPRSPGSGMMFDDYEIDRINSGANCGGQPKSLWNQMDYDISNVAWIALRRFPELQKGEHIGLKEIQARLKGLKKAGYPAFGYSGINAREAWNYLKELRSAIAMEARSECPSVLEEIESANRAAIEDVKRYR